MSRHKSGIVAVLPSNRLADMNDDLIFALCETDALFNVFFIAILRRKMPSTLTCLAEIINRFTQLARQENDKFVKVFPKFPCRSSEKLLLYGF